MHNKALKQNIAKKLKKTKKTVDKLEKIVENKTCVDQRYLGH